MRRIRYCYCGCHNKSPSHWISKCVNFYLFCLYFKHIIETSLRTHLRMPSLQHDSIQSIFKDSLTSSQAALQASKENAKERVKEGILLIERLLPYCCAVLCCYTPSVVGLGLSTLTPCVCWRTPWKGRRLALAWIRRDAAEMFDPTKFQGFLLCVCRRCVCSPPTRQMMMMMMVARLLLTDEEQQHQYQIYILCW